MRLYNTLAILQNIFGNLPLYCRVIILLPTVNRLSFIVLNEYEDCTYLANLPRINAASGPIIVKNADSAANFAVCILVMCERGDEFTNPSLRGDIRGVVGNIYENIFIFLSTFLSFNESITS